jgi:O-antigen ligase
LFAGNWGPRGLIVLGNLYELETNPLALASLGGTVFVGALLLLRMPQPWWRKVILAVLIPIGIAVIIRSQSRGQLGAAGLAAAIGWIFVSRKAITVRLFSLAIAAVVVGSMGWWVWDQLQVDAQRWSGDLAESDLKGRLEMAKALLSEAARSPVSLIFGLGNSSSYGYLGIYPHITPLEVLAEEGLLGFTLYSACIALTLMSAAKVFGATNERSDTGHRVAAAAVLSLFLFELMLSMKQGSFLSSTYVFAYAAIIGRMALWPLGEDAGVVPEQSVQSSVLAPANLMR